MKRLPVLLFLGSFFLILFGLYLVMSASSTYSGYKFADQFHMFNSHLFKAFGGIALMMIVAFVPYDYYKKYSKLILFAVVGMLILTLLVSTKIKGAHRWLDLGFVSFQPADIAKIALFIHLAALLEEKGESIKMFKEGFRYALIWIFVITGLIFIQPNVSGGLILLFISFLILFVGGAKLKHLFASVIVTGAVGAMITMIFRHSRERVLTFISSLQDGGAINEQVRQAMVGLATGHWIGVGFGHSNQRNLFLPEAYGDFIFAILGEETGFIGVVVMLLVYLCLFFIGIVISKHAKDPFGQYLGFAISFSFIVSAFINAAVASGLLPTTGLPLPFLSYGGTSMTILCISMGILINIGISSAKQKIEEEAVVTA
ncbi:MAG: putative peptidoglycan glycosyltransferase FtsW [Ignavibacteriaceae bacterium]